LKTLLLAISIIVLFSSNSYADSIPAEVCFVNRIFATGCLGAIAVIINPAPYVIGLSLSAFSYSIYSYREKYVNCTEFEITGDQIKAARANLENQTDKMSVDKYNALKSLLVWSESCLTIEEFHEKHDGAVYGKIRYSKEEIGSIFDWILWGS